VNIKTLCFAASSLTAVMAGASVAAADGATPASGYEYADFYDVPRLGHETVVGTGCGGDGSLGATIPDGYWRGYVTSSDPDTAIELDVTCVYHGTINADLVSRWRAEHRGQLEPWTPDGFVVNNSTRTRTVPTASGVVYHGTEFGADGSCRFDQPDIPYEIGEDSWVRIVNGEVQWVVSGCATPGEIGPWTPQPQPGTGLAFPYAEFWDVPQLGAEPVHGTGCGGDGSLGDTIPDGFWYGWSSGLSGTSLQFDVGCMYHGARAEQLCDEFAADNPNYGSPPCWGSGADAHFLVNNSTRTRTVPLAPTFTAADAEWVDNGDGTLSCVPTPNTSGMNGGMGEWLYIENGLAQYSLRECAHD
jgi:hypothetical protein